MSWPDATRLRWTPTVRVRSDDGTAIAVEILGDTHPGPTVVFVHGWTFSSRSWHYQRMLAERWRLVLMDHRGHGESEPGPRENRTIDQLGRDLKAVLDETCAGRDVVLVGHSMGGMTILSLAAQHPELFGTTVKGVGLLDTSARRDPEYTFGLRGRFAEIMSKQWKKQFDLMVNDPEKAARARRPGNRLSLAVNKWLNFGVKPDRRLALFTEAMSSATAPDVVGDFWLTLDVHDKLAALETVAKVPTLVLVGDRDRLTPPADARVIAAGVPGARLLELKGAGHCAMLEQPGEVNAALTDLVLAATDVGAYPDEPPTAPKPRNRKPKVAS